MNVMTVIGKLPADTPLWAYFLVLSACLLIYICRMIVVYKLGSKALDKVSAEKVPEVMNSVTGYHAKTSKNPGPPVGGTEPGS